MNPRPNPETPSSLAAIHSQLQTVGNTLAFCTQFSSLIQQASRSPGAESILNRSSDTGLSLQISSSIFSFHFVSLFTFGGIINANSSNSCFLCAPLDDLNAAIVEARVPQFTVVVVCWQKKKKKSLNQSQENQQTTRL